VDVGVTERGILAEWHGAGQRLYLLVTVDADDDEEDTMRMTMRMAMAMAMMLLCRGRVDCFSTHAFIMMGVGRACKGAACHTSLGRFLYAVRIQTRRSECNT
jgi:hypothetical protein